MHEEPERTLHTYKLCIRKMAEKKEECCKLCKWWVETVDGMGFCKYYSFLCPATDEACNSIFLEEKENLID